MATRKPSMPTAAQFDAWSEDDEAKVIAEIVETSQVKYVVTPEKNFYGRFPDGEVVTVPLRVTLETVDQITTVGDAEVDQLKMLFTILGMDEEAESTSKRDITEMVDFAAKYFKVLQKVQQATVGE